MIKFQENTQTDVRREGRTDHISQDPSSYRQGLTSTTAVDWHLKAKNYCITVSMQKISSIHKLIQQILGYHELNDHTHFWPGPHKNHWNNSLLSWSCNTMQKISSFHQFILEIQSRDQITVGGQWKPTRNKKNGQKFLQKKLTSLYSYDQFFFSYN